MRPASFRRTYAVVLIITIAIGLTIHLHGIGVPSTARDIAGDALWAVMMFWLVSFAAPDSSMVARTLVALSLCFAVEFSQHIQHPILHSLRDSTLGHLVLGSDFDARDLLAYTAGIALATLTDRMIRI